MALCKHYFGPNLTLESFKLCLMVVFLIELTFLSQISSFSKNLNHQWKCRKQKENFQAILVIVFWNFKAFLQVRCATSKTKLDTQYNKFKFGIRVVSRVDKRLKTQDLRNLGNIRQISNLGGGIGQYPVSLTEMKLWQQQLKKDTKVDLKAFLFCPVSLGLSIYLSIFPIYFVQNCRQKISS